MEQNLHRFKGSTATSNLIVKPKFSILQKKLNKKLNLNRQEKITNEKNKN
jgi:hypothetical protein